MKRGKQKSKMPLAIDHSWSADSKSELSRFERLTVVFFTFGVNGLRTASLEHSPFASRAARLFSSICRNLSARRFLSSAVSLAFFCFLTVYSASVMVLRRLRANCGNGAVIIVFFGCFSATDRLTFSIRSSSAASILASSVDDVTSSACCLSVAFVSSAWSSSSSSSSTVYGTPFCGVV